MKLIKNIFPNFISYDVFKYTFSFTLVRTLQYCEGRACVGTARSRAGVPRAMLGPSKSLVVPA
jgi:hypothetical protein